MAMDLNTLQQLMGSQGADATANTVLTDRLAEAQALRGSVPSAERTTGYVDPLSVITSLIQGSKGRKQVAELQPQQEAAQRRVNDLASAKEQYGLNLAANKVTRDQGNLDRTFGAGRDDAAAVEGRSLRQALALKNQQDRNFGVGEGERQLAAETQAKPEQFWTIEGDEPVLLSRDQKNRLISPSGERVDAAEFTSVNPLDRFKAEAAANKKSRSGGKGKKDVDPMALVADPDAMGRIITNPELGSTTGMLDPTRYLASAGFAPFADDPEAVSKRQNLSLDMKGAALNSVKTNLEGLGVNPTDKDLEVAFGDIPSQNAEPLTWGTWAQDKYKPALINAFNKAIINGDATKEQRDAYLKSLDADITENRRMWTGADGDTPNAAKQAVDTSDLDAQIEALEAELRGD